MKNWKSVLILLLCLATFAILSHRALSKRPIELLVIKTDVRVTEVYHLTLFLNGIEPGVETLRVDTAVKKKIQQALAKRDRGILLDVARELGSFQEVSLISGMQDDWPWYLGGKWPGRSDDLISTMNLFDKFYYAWMTSIPPSPEFKVADAVPDKTVELHPEDWIQTHPLNASTKEASKTAKNEASAPLTQQAMVKVEILNDCGIKGAADGIARAVQRPGVHILFVGNALKFKYRSTRIQSSVGVPVVLQDILDEMGISENAVEEVMAGRRKADVTFIVGRDYKKILENMRERIRQR